jgi:hypothetical protein
MNTAEKDLIDRIQSISPCTLEQAQRIMKALINMKGVKLNNKTGLYKATFHKFLSAECINMMLEEETA